MFHNNQDKYSALLYNWFGGIYDGQSYYIKNIRISSHCYNVGLFGSTAGAEIRNIVLYSDNGSVIERDTDASSWTYQHNGTPDSVREYQCAYGLGGLAGIAYDYASERGTSLIYNCAIAGYVVRDSSRNTLALGEAAVGGLIGVSEVSLMNCSAVVDVEVNCTHLWQDGSLSSAKYGNFVRVGGLVGGLRYKAINCYTGGSITVSPDTLKERILYGDSTNTQFQTGTLIGPAGGIGVPAWAAAASRPTLSTSPAAAATPATASPSTKTATPTSTCPTWRAPSPASPSSAAWPTATAGSGPAPG